jgi:hypothetical protein
MARSKTLSALLDSITPEMEQSWKEERIMRKNMLTAEYQLGYYVGLRIVDEYLPTLSTDKIQSRRVIGVPKEDAAENGRLNEEWFDIARTGKNGDKEKWDLLFNHNKMLEKKYLPNPLLCHLSPLNIQSMEQFKLGLRLALWDCDMCSYKIESDDIKIYDDEDARFTIIEFSL